MEFDERQQPVLDRATLLALFGSELRTPLEAILSLSEQLLDEAREAGDVAYLPGLRRLEDASRRLVERIDRTRAGEPHPPRFSEVDLGEVLLEVGAAGAPLAASNGTGLVVRPARGLPAVWTDAAAVRETLLHLVGNAARHTPNGRIELVAEIVGQEEARQVRIHVRDTGSGLKPHVLMRVFQAAPGSGLAFSRHVIRGLGGELTAESIHGEGSTFTIQLPLPPGLRRAG